MALDGVVIAKLKLELTENLISKKVYKIMQYDKDSIVFCFNDINLLLSANPTYPRVYLTNKEFIHDNKNSNFFNSLKKHLSGAIVKRINQPNLDRVLMIEFIALNDFKEKVNLTLCLEVMGKYSNLILIDENGKVIDSIKHVTDMISSIRTVMPKVSYELPKVNGKLNLLNASDKEIENLIKINLEDKNSDISSDLTLEDYVSFITSNFIGISKLIAQSYFKDKCEKTDNASNDYSHVLSNINNFKNYIEDIISNMTSLNYANFIFVDENNNTKDFYITNINFNNNKKFESIKYDTVSSMIEEFFLKKAFENSMNQKVSDIKTLVNNLYSKAIKKKEIHNEVIISSKNCEDYKIHGDLIFSNLYNIKQGDTKVKVMNYYDNNKMMEIKLDKDKSPSDNANSYYKKYNKLKSSLRHSTLQLKEIDEEIIYLESVLSYIENAITNDDIINIKEELIESGYLKKKVTKNKNANKIKKDTTKPYHFTSSDGFEIYVGKNNIQNDEVTFKIGKDSDMWLHAKDMPGSHVIIKNNGKEISETAILEATQLAAYFSKGRNSSNTPIDYTLRKFVKKPSGAKAGFVIYLNNKTNFITVNEKLLKELFNIKTM